MYLKEIKGEEILFVEICEKKNIIFFGSNCVVIEIPFSNSCYTSSQMKITLNKLIISILVCMYVLSKVSYQLMKEVIRNIIINVIMCEGIQEKIV